ncbi:MAG: DUF4433 domain-containing protein, partial [Alphaproteobacteria bacterium]|nr:DUF4433 domain-containing protein [Alphaproteobacteria bacterium]
EFLVHRTVPWPLIERVGVVSTPALARVTAILAGSVHRPAVSVETDWYY